MSERYNELIAWYRANVVDGETLELKPYQRRIIELVLDERPSIYRMGRCGVNPAIVVFAELTRQTEELG